MYLLQENIVPGNRACAAECLCVQLRVLLHIPWSEADAGAGGCAERGSGPPPGDHRRHRQCPLYHASVGRQHQDQDAARRHNSALSGITRLVPKLDSPTP